MNGIGRCTHKSSQMNKEGTQMTYTVGVNEVRLAGVRLLHARENYARLH